MEVRPALASDAAALLALRRRVFAESDTMLFEPDEFSASVEDERRRIVELSSPTNGRYLVASDGDAIVGFGLAQRGKLNRLRHAASLALGVAATHVGRAGRDVVGVLLSVLRVVRPRIWAGLQHRSTACLLAGVVGSAFALALFRERTGLLANTLGWPALSAAFGLLVVAGSDPRGVLSGGRVPGPAYLAAISYSLYLSHKIAYHLVQVHVAPALQGHGTLLFLAYALAALGLGALLHHAVERPFLHWRDRRERLLRGSPVLPSPARRTA